MSEPWSSVTQLCSRILEMLPRLAAESTSRIRQDLRDYDLVPLAEHLEAVMEQQGRRLDAIAERRPLDARDLEQAARLAQLRARQGISVDVLIGAYHVGDRELWRMLCANAGGAEQHLPAVASLMLESLHAISTVLASAHGEVTRQLHGHRITLSQRFVELLAGEGREAETHRIAEALDFDPTGDFVVLVWRPESRQAALPSMLQRELDDQRASLVHAYHDDEVVFVAQQVDASRLVDLGARHLPNGTAGLGLSRTGLAGAALSLTDARLALKAASPGRRLCQFGDVWHDVCLLSQAERVAPMTMPAVGVATAHPHLAEAVLQHAAASMSIAGTAKLMHLHANTVTYRLDRWYELTGWNARTFEGLNKSVIACRVARE